MRSSHILSVLFGLLLCFFAAPALAHIQITFPPPREGTGTPELKNQPCGTTGLTRSTIPARISTFQPGQTITVRWTETVGHPGHFRIAFLQNGNAFADPTSFTDIQTTPVLPILKDGIVSSGITGTQFMMAVTLPNVECNNCTLQVIQVMTDKAPFSASPPLGTGDDVYHQCADIVLSAGADAGGPTTGAGGAGAGGARPDGGATSTGTGAGTGGTASGSGGSSSGVGSTTGAGGSGGSTGSATSGGTTTTTGGSAGSSATNGSSGASGNQVSPAADNIGCSCRFVGPVRSESQFACLFALGLGTWIRRRRRS